MKVLRLLIVLRWWLPLVFMLGVLCSLGACHTNYDPDQHPDGVYAHNIVIRDVQGECWRVLVLSSKHTYLEHLKPEACERRTER